MKFTTYGDVRGQGKVFDTQHAAENSLAADQRGCAKQGGYSDRQVVAIDEDGYLRQIEDGKAAGYIWPSWGKSSGAVKAE